MNVGDEFRIPDISEFVDGFQYQRCDSRDTFKPNMVTGHWFDKTYKVTPFFNTEEEMKDNKPTSFREYDRGDVVILLPQGRIRVSK
jgi:hypothetical protein